MKETRLRKYRNLLGYSQAKLSGESGVNIRTVKAYDSGERDINGASVATVALLADVLECRIEDLMEREAEEKFYTVIDDCDTEIYPVTFTTLKEAKEEADSIYNHLTGFDIRRRKGLYVMETDGIDLYNGNEVYRLI